MTDVEFLRNEIEPYIDNLYKDFALLKLDRDVAIVHLLRFFEDSSRFGSLITLSRGDRLQYYLSMRHAHESLPWAIRWVWRDCPRVGATSLALDWDAYGEAFKLMQLAHDYDQLVGCFTLYSRNIFSFELHRSSHLVKFAFTSKDVELKDGARALYSIKQESPPIAEKLLEFLDDNRAVIRTILPHYIDKIGEFSVKYEVAKDLHDIFKKWAVLNAAQMRFVLPDSWKVGSFSLGQFRSFWTSLLYAAILHTIAHAFADKSVGTSGGAIETAVMALTVAELDKLGGIFPLDSETFATIRDLLTYEPSRNYWDPFWQPLFRIADGRFLLCPSLILGSSAQRNLVNLMTKTEVRRKLYDAISVQKEEEQLNEMERVLSFGNHTIKRQVPLPRLDGSILSDIDLLILDRNTRFVLLVQAKWLMYPDHITETLNRDAEVKTALELANTVEARVRDLGVNWLSRIFGEDLGDSEVRVGSILVNRDFVPSGWVSQESVPAVDLAFLKEAILSSGDRGLSEVHARCLDFDDELLRRFPSEPSFGQIQFGKYSFEVPTVETGNFPEKTLQMKKGPELEFGAF